MGAAVDLDRLHGGPAPVKHIKLHTQQGVVFKAWLTVAFTALRYFVVACGRRWGKTILGCTMIVWSAGRKPGRYWYVAPTLKDARDIAWRLLVDMVPRSWLKRAPNETRLEIELKNGSLISLKGADDPDSLRGRGLRGCVVDEYADIKANLWDEILAPALLDKDGWACFLGTPKGFDHFYDLFGQGKNAAFPEWVGWQFKTADAPHIKPEKLAALRRQYEQRGQLRLYQQEFEASFESNAGYILGAIWQPSHTVTLEDVALVAAGLQPGQVIPWHVLDNPQWRPPSSALIYGSVDYGFGAPWSAHLHAALVGGHTRTFREWYAREVKDYEQARRIRAGIEELMAQGMARPEWIVMDPSMWNSRREMGLAKSIAEVYDDELGRPLNIPLVPGAAGRPARVSRPQRWMAALEVAGDGLPWHSVTTACPELIRTVPRVPWDPDDLEVEDDDSENHSFEDGGRFFEARPHIPKAPASDPYAGLDEASRAHHQALDKARARQPGKFDIRNLRPLA
jgi:hypothetical protein